MLYRDLRLFLRALAATLVMGILILMVCAGLVWAITASETGSRKLLQVAVSNGDTESPLGEMALRLVSSHELVSSLVTIQLCDTPEDAIEAVEEGAAAAVILPDGFFSSIMSGEDLPCRLILSQANESGRNTVAAYADVGSDLLSAAQYAVYSGAAYLQSQGVSGQALSDYIYQLDMDSFTHVSKAQKQYFEACEIPYTAGGLSMLCHYVAVYLAFFFSMLILSFSHLYNADRSRDTLLRLRASGITEAAFLRWKLLLPGLLFLLLTGILLPVAVRFLHVQLTPVSILCAIAAGGFCAAFGGLLAFGLGSFGGSAQFLVTALGLFLCGGIIPYSRMNPMAASIGSYTPLGVIYGLLSPLLGGRLSWQLIPTAGVYLALAALLVRRHFARMLKGRDGL